MKLSTFAKTIEDKGVSISFIPHNEGTSIRDGYFDSKETEDKIIEDYENGNDAAWFCAEVKLTYFGLVSDSEYLGACSYQSFDEFTGTDGDYFDDMLNTCLADLKVKLLHVKNAPELN